LRWGGDAEGGAPFVEADPSNPALVRGFDVEIAEEIARGLGRSPRFVQVAWAAIDQSVERGDFDVGLSGVEDAPGRRAQHATTLPYFEFREVLAVRRADRDRIRTLADLKGRRAATLGSTLAYQLLLSAREEHGVIPVSYDDDVHPYTDLEAGRVDAVLLDHVIAERALRRGGKFHIQPNAVATGYYVGVLASGDGALRDSIDAIFRARMRDGSLERIFRKWGVWDEAQGRHFARVVSGDPAGVDGSSGSRASATTYLPALLRAAGLTLLLSVLAMGLAVTAGGLIAAGRVYGGRFTRAALTAYVETVRGTPLLLQLFVIYYGLSGVVRLPAFLAALLGRCRSSRCSGWSAGRRHCASRSPR
jgi:polar amino acid transport system substrate-binding protein